MNWIEVFTVMGIFIGVAIYISLVLVVALHIYDIVNSWCNKAYVHYRIWPGTVVYMIISITFLIGLPIGLAVGAK